jgi:hypothetical protein
MAVVKRGHQVLTDPATPDTVHISMDILQNLFPGHLISRLGDVAFPARSLELTALDFFLRDYLKSNVCYN